MDDDEFSDLLNTNPATVWSSNPWESSPTLPSFPSVSNTNFDGPNTNFDAPNTNFETSDGFAQKPDAWHATGISTAFQAVSISPESPKKSIFTHESEQFASGPVVEPPKPVESVMVPVETVQDSKPFDPFSLIPDDDEDKRVKKTIKKKKSAVSPVVKTLEPVTESVKEAATESAPVEEPVLSKETAVPSEVPTKETVEVSVEPTNQPAAAEQPVERATESAEAEEPAEEEVKPIIEKPVEKTVSPIKKKKSRHLQSWLANDDIVANPLMDPNSSSIPSPAMTPSPAYTRSVTPTMQSGDPLEQKDESADPLTTNDKTVKKTKLRSSVAHLGQTFAFADPLVSGLPQPAPAPVVTSPVVSGQTFADIFASAAPQPESHAPALDAAPAKQEEVRPMPLEKDEKPEKEKEVPPRHSSLQAATQAATQAVATPVVQATPRETGPIFFRISVHSPARLGGISAHTIYKVTTVTNHPQLKSRMGNTVLRRYRDFLWLHDQLSARCGGTIVPPIPGKHVMGRFEDEFVEERRVGLERMIRRVVGRDEFLQGHALQDVKTFLESERFEVESQLQTVKQPSAGLWKSSVPEADVELDACKMDMAVLEGQLKQLDKVLGVVAKRRTELMASVDELCDSIRNWAALEESKGLMSLVNVLNQVKAQLDKERKDWTALTLTVNEYLRTMEEIENAFQARTVAFSKWKHAEQKVGTKRAVLQQSTGSTSLSSAGKAIAMQQELAEAEGYAAASRKEFEQVGQRLSQELVQWNRQKVADLTISVVHLVTASQATKQQVVSIWKSVLPSS